MNEVKGMKTAQSMKVMKTMTAMKGKTTKNPAKKAMEAMKTAKKAKKATEATETAVKKMPETRCWTKVWAVEHMGTHYKWKLDSIVNKGGFVTEVWNGKLRGDSNKQ